MESISFSKFPEAELNTFSKRGDVTFRYNIGNIRSNHVEQYLYSYFVTPASKNGVYWNVQGVPIGNFPTVYEKKLGITNITWRFNKGVPGEIDLLLVYIVGNGILTRAELVYEPNVRKEEIVLALKPLIFVARKFGIPKDGLPLSQVYSYGEEKKKTDEVINRATPNDDRYFRVLGLVPTSNMGLVKAAYRELVKQFHPDINGGISQERMKEINDAYEHIISSMRNKGAFR